MSHCVHTKSCRYIALASPSSKIEGCPYIMSIPLYDVTFFFTIVTSTPLYVSLNFWVYCILFSSCVFLASKMCYLSFDLWFLTLWSSLSFCFLLWNCYDLGNVLSLIWFVVSHSLVLFVILFSFMKLLSLIWFVVSHTLVLFLVFFFFHKIVMILLKVFVLTTSSMQSFSFTYCSQNKYVEIHICICCKKNPLYYNVTFL
jgi:hypothetical protein